MRTTGVKFNTIAHFAVLFGVAALGLACSNAKLIPLATTYPVVTLQIQNYCPDTYGSGANIEIYNYKDIFFSNSQSSFSTYQYIVDTDGDGLSDAYEQTAANTQLWGISYLFADTSQNGYSDLVKVKMGIPVASQVNMPTCSTGYQDSDNDGLTDCEEQLVGTTVGASDTDGDGVPDGLEFRLGMNPLVADAYVEITGDGYSNYQKAKWGVPVSTFVNASAKALFPVYQQSPTVKPNTATCANPVTFNISNISVMPVTTGNTFKVVTIEDPQTPSVGGTQYARQSQYLTIQVPATVTTGSTIIIPNGINNQIITHPTIAPPAGS